MGSTFFVSDKDGSKRFFEENFILADVQSNIVLGMLFLTISNANVDFQVWDLEWRSYTIGNLLPTIRRGKMIRKKKFATAILDPEHKIFIVNIAALSINSDDEMYLSRET